MDNHAGNLFWLAGFIDADGSVGLHKQRQPGGKVTWVPSLSVTTTCDLTADHISDVLKSLNLPFFRMLRKVTKPNWTDRHLIEIRGMKRISKILPLLIPRLVTKQQEAQLVMRFISSRKQVPMKRPYSDEELEMVLEVRNIKRARHK